MQLKQYFTKFNISIFLGFFLLAVLLPALLLEYVGYPVCNLCYKERIAYYITIVLSFLVAFLSFRSDKFQNIVKYLFLLIALIFFFNFILSMYHFGIELRFFPLPDSCINKAAPDNLFSNDLLAALSNTTPPVSCDMSYLKLLGLPLVLWNAIISFMVTIVSILASNLRR